MKFCTKKSVAIILTTILFVGFFSFNTATAYESPNYTPNPPLSGDSVGTTYKYAGNKNWIKIGDKSINAQYKEFRVFPNGTPANWLAEEVKVDNTPAPTTTAADTSSGFGALLAKIGDYAVGVTNLGGFAIVSATLGAIHIILSLLTALAGMLFDKSVDFSILHISDLFSNVGVVNILWAMMRDLLNICFIFILLYLAISKIIGSFGVKAKTTIVSVIISAVLINFSMFFTKILIDAGNMVAVSLYNLIIGNNITMSLSAMIFKGTGLFSSASSVFSLKSQLNIEISLLLQVVAMAILLWTYLYYAIVIVGRTVMLMFLTIISPVGFVGKTIPGLGALSDWWWKNLTDQILVAPLVMFFLYFIILLINTGTVQKVLSAAQTTGSQAAVLDVSGLFVYILIIVMLLQGLKIVKKFSGEVGAMTTKVIGGIAAAGAVALTAGAAGATIGAGALSSAGATAAAGAAARAGGGKMAQLGARLAFSGKNIGETLKAGKETVTKMGETKVGKFVTGKYDKTGVTGWAKTLVRDKAMVGVKEATGGTLDLKAIEKTMKESKTAAKKNLNDEADKFTKPYEDKEKQNKIIESRIKEAGAKAAINTPKEQAHKDAETEFVLRQEEKNNTKNVLKEKRKAVEESQKELDKAFEGFVPPGPLQKAQADAYAAHNQAKKEFKEATWEDDRAGADFSQAEAKVNEFTKNYAAKQKIEQEKAEEKMAEELGVVAASVLAEGIDPETGEKELQVVGKSYVKGFNEMKKNNADKLAVAEGERNKFITDKIQNGSYWGTLLFGGERKKFSDEVRARTYKPDGDQKKAIKDFLKTLGMKPEDLGAGGTPPPAGGTSSPAGGTPSTP